MPYLAIVGGKTFVWARAWYTWHRCLDGLARSSFFVSHFHLTAQARVRVSETESRSIVCLWNRAKIICLDFSSWSGKAKHAFLESFAVSISTFNHTARYVPPLNRNHGRTEVISPRKPNILYVFPIACLSFLLSSKKLCDIVSRGDQRHRGRVLRLFCLENVCCNSWVCGMLRWKRCGCWHS